MQGLRVSLYGRQCFDTGAGNIVERVLFGQTPSRSLAVRAQHQGFGVRRVEPFDDFGPQHSGRSELCDLHEKIHADTPEKRQAGSEVVDLKPGIYAGSQVCEPVGKGIGQLQIGGCSGFLHMVS